jgi:hypothetical protein
MFLSEGLSQLWERIDWQIHSQDHPRPTTDALLADLPDFPFSRGIVASRAFDKTNSVGVFASLATKLSPSEIAARFKASLLAKGWVVRNEKTEPYISLKLCRRGIAVTIEPSTTTNGTKVAIILGWSYSKVATSYCPT